MLEKLLLSAYLHGQTISSMRAGPCLFFSASYFPCHAQCVVHELSIIFINLWMEAVLNPDYALGADNVVKRKEEQGNLKLET